MCSRLAVPSWRAVSVPEGSAAASSCRTASLQCPHGGQSPCRSRTGCTTPMLPRTCSALMAGSLRAGSSLVDNLWITGGTCSALMAGSLRAGVHDLYRHPRALCLAVPSWRAVSVPARARLRRDVSVDHLQCPHGGQSPCRATRATARWPWLSSCSALMAGSLRAGAARGADGPRGLRLAVPSWRAVSVPDTLLIDPTQSTVLAVPSWRAVSVPDGLPPVA